MLRKILDPIFGTITFIGIIFMAASDLSRWWPAINFIGIGLLLVGAFYLTTFRPEE